MLQDPLVWVVAYILKNAYVVFTPSKKLFGKVIHGTFEEGCGFECAHSVC